MEKPNKQYMSIGEAAQKLGVSIDTIRRWEASGKIVAHRTPKGVRLFDVDLIAKLTSQVKDLSNYYTVTQAATYLGVTATTLRRWDRQGALTPKRTIGNERMYDKTELETFTQESARTVGQSVKTTPVAFIKEKAIDLSDILVINVLNFSWLKRYHTALLLGVLTVLLASSGFAGTVKSAATVSDPSNLPQAEITDNISQLTAESAETNNLLNGPETYATRTVTLTNSSGSLEFSSPQGAVLITSSGESLPVAVRMAQDNNTLVTPQLTTATVKTNFDSGSGAVPTGKIVYFVPAIVNSASKIFLSQTGNAKVFITVLEKKPGLGFTIQLSNQSQTPVKFDWLIVN